MSSSPERTSKSTWTRSSPPVTRSHRQREAAERPASSEDWTCRLPQAASHGLAAEGNGRPQQTSASTQGTARTQSEAEAWREARELSQFQMGFLTDQECKELLLNMLTNEAARAALQRPASGGPSTSAAAIAQTTATQSQADAAAARSAPRFTSSPREGSHSGEDSLSEAEIAQGNGEPSDREGNMAAFLSNEDIQKHGRKKKAKSQNGRRSTSASKMAAHEGKPLEKDKQASETGATHHQSRRAPDATRECHDAKATREAKTEPETGARRKAPRTSSKPYHHTASTDYPPEASGGEDQAPEVPGLERALQAAMSGIRAAILEAIQPRGPAAEGDQVKTRPRRRETHGFDQMTTPKGPREDSSASGDSSTTPKGPREDSPASGDSSSGSSDESSTYDDTGLVQTPAAALQASVSDASPFSGRFPASLSPKGEASAQAARPRPEEASLEGALQERCCLSESQPRLRTARAQSSGHARLLTCQNQLAVNEETGLCIEVPLPFTLGDERDILIDKKLLKILKTPIVLPQRFKRLELSGTNHSEWKKDFQVVLLREGCLYLLDKPPPQPWSPEVDALHRKAFAAFLLAIDSALYAGLAHGLKLREAWDKLDAMFHSKNIGATSRLLRQFHNLRLRPGVDMGKHLATARAMRAELIHRGEPVSDVSLVSVLLDSVKGPEWDTFVVTMEGDSNKYDLDYLSGRMIEEFRRQQDNPTRHRPNNQRGHHRTHRQPARHEDSFEPVNSLPGCFICGSHEHFKSNCPKMHVSNQPSSRRGAWRGGRKGHGHGRGKQKPFENNAVYNTDVIPPHRDGFWIMDSGAGAHIATAGQPFTKFVPIQSSVRMANGNPAKVTGIGTVDVPGIGELRNVLQVPTIPNNLMSVMKLCDNKKVTVAFRWYGGKIFKRGRVIGKMGRKGNTPYLIPKGGEPHGAVAQRDGKAPRKQGVTQSQKKVTPAPPGQRQAPVALTQPEPMAEASASQSTVAEATARPSYANVVKWAKAPQMSQGQQVADVPKPQRNKKAGKHKEKKNNITTVVEGNVEDNVYDNNGDDVHDNMGNVIGVLDEDTNDIIYTIPVETVNKDDAVVALCGEEAASAAQAPKRANKKKGSKGKKIKQSRPSTSAAQEAQGDATESSTPVPGRRGQNVGPDNSETQGAQDGAPTSCASATDKKGQSVSVGKPLHNKCAHVLHRKIAHAGFGTVKKMQECTEGLVLQDCDVYLECSVCKQAKSKVAPTPKTSTRKTDRPYQLIHTDVVGPFPESIGRKKFFLTVVDDFSRFGHIFTMREKTEVLGHLQYLYNLVETQHGMRISQIQSDRGSEYTSHQFQDWVRAKGIKHFTPPPFHPAGNGVSERRNGVLQTMKNSLLADANLGHGYWGEAIVTANYILNRTWSSVVEKTPYEMLYKRKPYIGHLHIFGSKAWVHIPRQQRRKGDPISMEMTFVGYATGTKGYRFLDQHMRVVISNSASFAEDGNWSRLHSNDLAIYMGSSNSGPIPPVTNPSMPIGIVPTEASASAPKTKKKPEKKKNNVPNDLPAEEAHTSATAPEVTAAPQRPGLPANRAGEDGYGEWEVVRRSNRTNKGKPPTRLVEDFIGVVNPAVETPKTFSDIQKLPDEEQRRWRIAMENEMKSLKQLQVFEPKPLPPGKKTIGTRWVYKLKQLANNKSLYKARLVAQGFSQRYLQDYCETYSPTVRAESVKAALVTAAAKGEVVYQYDVQTAYLHADLDHRLYVRCAPGFEDSEGRTWLLKKSLYGLKQSGKQWYDCLAKALTNMGYRTSPADECVFVKHSQEGHEKVLVYVDDLLYIGPSPGSGSKFAKTLGAKFTLKSLGQVSKYLGVQISRTEKGFALCQEEKVRELISKCKMTDSNPVNTPMQTDFWGLTHKQSPAFEENTTYRSVIGSLLYISNWSRPDIALAVNLLARHVESPKVFHWLAAKRVLRYLCSTASAALLLEPTIRDRPSLSACADADWAQDPKTRRSTSGFLILLNGSPIHWHVGQQKFTSCSSAESEYACLSDATNDLQWFDSLVSSLWEPPPLPHSVMEDNTGAIGISRALSVGPRSRHIDIRYRNVRQLAKMGFVTIVHRRTEEQVADIFTKPLNSDRHNYLCGKLCLALRS